MSDFEKYWEENASKESWANKAVAWNIWKEKQAIIDDLKAQLNNMEACYIEKKKEVEAANTVLINWQDEYTEHTRQHECTTDAVLRTCITELEQALRGES